MSSLFRGRRQSAAGGGGKILRGRRAPPPAAPYHRPTADREAGQSRGATWISGIVAGAGRLISSVFESESPSSSYSYSTDGDDEGSSINSHEDMDVSSKEPVEAKQIERKLEPVKDCNRTSLAIISEIDSKHAIEQLLMQETFSRDEGDKLIQIIESRVVEDGNDGKQKELDRITCNAFASPGTGKYLNLPRKLPEAISYSSGSPHAISPGSSAFQVLTPELRNSAVMEAKKWLEEKRLASGSQVDFGCRPCSSNTSMLQYQDFGGEDGSPIDVAKSYMRSLSPWRSPLLSCTRFKKTPCTRMLLYRDEPLSTTPNYSLPASKGLKRNHPAIGLPDNADEIHKVRLKLTDDESNSCTFKLIDSSKGYSKDEACKMSSVADDPVHQSKLPLESLDTSADFSVEHVGDYCSIGTLVVPGEKNDDVNYLVRTSNTMSPVLIETEEAVIELDSLAVQLTHEPSSLATLPSKLNSSVGAGPDFCDNPMPTSDDNQDVEEPWEVKEQLDNISDPCTIPIPASKSVEYAGDHSETLLTSKAQKLSPVEIKSTLRDIEEGTRLDDVNASSIQLMSGEGEENNSLNAEQISRAKEIHSVSDPVQQDRIGQAQDEATQQDGSDQMQHEASDLRISAYRPLALAGLNTNINVALGDEPNTTRMKYNDGPAADISNRICELASVETSNVPSPRKTSSTRGRPRGGTRMKSVKDAVLTEGTEPQPSSSTSRGRGRGRKSAPGARRGRGRGKSFTPQI